MSISFGSSALLLVVCLLAAAGLSYWVYRRTTPPVSSGRRLLLGGLRFIALAIVLFLLFEPIVRRLDEDQRPPMLAVLFDDTASLQVTAGGASPSEDTSATPQTAIRNALNQLRADDLEGERRYFAFGSAIRTLPSTGPLDSLRFDGARTDIATALESAREELQNENLKGIVLISDGQYNTGRNPLYLAERSPVPIHTVAIGDTTRRRDVQIRRITTNDIAYVDTELPIQVGLRAESASGERVTVSLLHDGERLQSTQIELPAGTAEIPIDLSYVPENAGLQRLSVHVTELDGEVTYRNNTRAFTVRVLESKRRILLLGAAPSPNFAATRRLLAQNRDTEVVPFVPQQGGSFYQGALPSDLSDFDVVVLAGFPSTAAPPSAAQRVADAVQNGLPVLFLIDRQTNLDMLRQYFEDVLPVTLEQTRSSFIEAVFDLNEQRLQHPIFNIPDATPEIWAQLPPLHYNESRWIASPDARVLATTKVRGVALDDPLLVIRNRAGQRSAALLGTGTWRWANLPEDLDAASSLWPSLLSNLVQWVTTREDDRPVRVQPVQETFAGGESVEFTGQVYNESLNPVDDAAVSVNVIAPDSTRYPYHMKPVGNGRYVLDIGTLPEGTYEYMAEAEQESSSLGTDRGQFAVGSLTLEYRNTRANAALLRQIAYRSGGIFHTIDNLSALHDHLATSDQFSARTITQEREIKLWHLYSFLIVIIALLASEWALRKRSGMV